MKKTKNIIAIIVAMIMCFTFVVALAACNKWDCDKSGHKWKLIEDEETETSEVKCSECGRSMPQYTNEQYREIYDATFGEFYTAYMQAKAATNNSQRFALMAIAEAKLLEANAFSFTNANGGNYAISRVAPHTVTDVRWGSDQDRLHQALVATTFIKAADRTALIAAWNQFKVGTNPDDNTTGHEYTGADFNAWAKNYLTTHGYTLKDEYRMAYGTEQKDWDVLATSEQTDSEVLVNTYDGLVEYDELTQIQPALAESWTVSEDGLTYTFKIREGIKWVDSTGREVADVKADDFVAGFQHMLDAQGGLEWLVDGLIVGASEYIAETEKDFANVGVKAIDDYTLEYKLEQETSYFLTMLGYSVFAPMSRSYFTSHGGAFGVREFATASASESYTYGLDQNNIAYCGPYLVKSFTDKNSMELEANQAYWNASGINIKKIVRLYSDGTVPTKLYDDAKAGTLDGAGLTTVTLPSSKTDKMAGDSASIFDTYAYVSGVDSTSFMVAYNLARTAYINWNDNTSLASTQTNAQMDRAHAALNNQNFRQALTFAFDRVAYRTARTGSADIAANALVNSYTPGDFVSLEEATTVKINGTDKTFSAGTMYGEIMQAQLDADNAGFTVWKQVNGEWKSTGFDGWYNPTKATEKLAAAVAELKEQGIEISKENPIILDVPNGQYEASFNAQAQSYKQKIEENLGGLVIINLTNATDSRQISFATYYVNFGSEVNYDVSTGWTGWGPDFGDPCTFLDTMLPDGVGYMTKLLGLW